MSQSNARVETGQVSYHGCKPKEPLVFSVSLFLAELFAPTNAHRTDLPLRLAIRPAKPTQERMPWTVPFANEARLEPRTIRRHRAKLKAANIGKAVLRLEAARPGIEQCLLDWIGPLLRVRVYHFPKGHMDPRAAEAWRIELVFVDTVIGQWDRAVADAKLDYFEPHVEQAA